MRTPDELTVLFRSSGRKVTAQRQCIFRLLQGDETHPSADPNVEDPHHHLVCQVCGSVRDLVVDFPDMSLPAGADLGFELGTAEVIFRGLCPDCRKATSARSSPGVPVGRPA